MNELEARRAELRRLAGADTKQAKDLEIIINWYEQKRKAA